MAKIIDVVEGESYRIAGQRGEFVAVSKISEEGWRFRSKKTMQNHAYRTTVVRKRKKARR